MKIWDLKTPEKNILNFRAHELEILSCDFNKYNNSDESFSSSYTDTQDDYAKYISLREKFESKDKNDDILCTQTMTHINTCKICQEKIRNMYKTDYNDICKKISISKLLYNICFYKILYVVLDCQHIFY